MHWNNHLVFEHARHMTVCLMTHDGTPENEVGEANARRLVACWNVFDGLPTEAIEQVDGEPATVGSVIEKLCEDSDEMLGFLRQYHRGIHLSVEQYEQLAAILAKYPVPA